MALAFGKSINVVSGFDLGAAVPVDTRYVVANIDARNAHVTNGRAYAGMLVYVESDQTIYKYTGSSWVAFGVTQDTTVSVSGDVQDTTFSVGDKATENLSLALKEIVTAGTACKITFNAKGLVTGVESLAASDIPTLTLSKISDAGTAAALNTGTSSGNVPVLDANGKLDTSVIPALALTEITVVANEAAMLALTAQPGDVAVREDESKSYMLKQAPASTLANWVELKTPADKVQSVNGKTGSVVLGTDDIAEGTNNLYYTDARATANFNTNFALASSTSLADTANIVYVGDAIPATNITEDATHRFVTDTEKALWNGAAHIVVGNDADSDAGDLAVGDWYYEIQSA